EIGAVYTTAELELRCKAPDRRRKLHAKLGNPQLFRPASLKSALSARGSAKRSALPGRASPLWVRPPKLQQPKKDDQVGQRRAIADRLAKSLLERRRTTDADVLKALQAWAFHDNHARQNVRRTGSAQRVFSDSLGLSLRRDGRLGLTLLSRQYVSFTKLLCKWLRDTRPKCMSETFPWTSISVNCNYAAARHRDKNNAGPSIIRGFGNYSGGELLYWPQDAREGPVSGLSSTQARTLSVKRKAHLLDGTKAHEVRQFRGERFSLVFYSCGKSLNATAAVRRSLQSLGFRPPTAEALRDAKEHLRRPSD
ncbi:polr1c, partial [Symbiodinium sp. KB8]